MNGFSVIKTGTPTNEERQKDIDMNGFPDLI
jgi:hypothetical protein